MADTATPEALGIAYEQGLDATTRRRLGAYYTPPALAAEVAAATLGPSPDAHTRICDPALGGGALLIAAARLLLANGADPAALAAHQLAGADIDAGAVEVARAGLRLVLGHEPAGLRVADSLDRATWDGAVFDAVLTNPPFLSQLQRRTARDRDEAGALVRAWGPSAMGYADAANLFVLLAVDLVRPGGRIGIILPEPLLSARDARAARRRVGSMSRLVRMWRPGLGAFDAGIRVFVSVLARTEPDASPWCAGDWASMAAEGVPTCSPLGDGAVGDVAVVTADFRDQYYGLTAVAVDSPSGGGHPVVTCGLIDPARVGWGQRPATVARARMLHPRAPLEMLAPPMQRWAAARLVPKVLVATQTRMLEAAADESGDWLPMVPVISVAPAPARLWHLLAALLAPPVAAAAHRQHTGSALSADAIKLSARQVAALPLPADHLSWDRGASLAREATMAARDGDETAWRGALVAMGVAMCDAYGVESATVMRWWTDRLDRVAKRCAVGS